MTVLSVGMDLVDVDDFGSLLSDRGTAFCDRVFTPGELAAADRLSGTRRDQHLAARFAAKEAFVKAWSGALPDGRPLVAQTESWAGIEIGSDRVGRPVITLRDGVAEAVSSSLGAITTHVSLTHESVIAAAVVILDRTEGAPT